MRPPRFLVSCRSVHDACPVDAVYSAGEVAFDGVDDGDSLATEVAPYVLVIDHDRGRVASVDDRVSVSRHDGIAARDDCGPVVSGDALAGASLCDCAAAGDLENLPVAALEQSFRHACIGGISTACQQGDNTDGHKHKNDKTLHCLPPEEIAG